MDNFTEESVIEINHITDTLFSFKTTRNKSFRFDNGNFVMIGFILNDNPILRAYSIVSTNYDEYLEFLSIKTPQGKLTTELQKLK